MNRAWNVFSVSGIRVRVHWTLVLLLAVIGLSEWHYAGVALLGALFGCVLLHELGHAFAARRYGIGTRSITLLPFGGIAALERLPATPLQELVVALAGPAVNIVLAALLWGASLVVPASLAPFVGTLLMVNVVLALFNLLPAFPMDGGRVLRAALSNRLGVVRATHIAVVLGRVLAVGFVVVGLLVGNPILILLAMVVWVQGGAEQRHVEQSARPRPEALSPHDTLSRPLTIFARTGQSEFPVLDHTCMVGILRREQLSVAFARFGPDMTVGSVMERMRPLETPVSAR